MMRLDPKLGWVVALVACCAATTAFAEDKKEGNELELAYNGHCRQCHSYKKDDNRLGPSLHGIIGKKAGTEKGFAYSDAIKNSGITWDDATLDKWITDPNSVVAGNNMGSVFPGVKEDDQRKKIIAFLKSKSEGGGDEKSGGGDAK